MFLFCLVFAMFCARLFICALWSPAGKGLTSWLSFVVSSVSLSLSHWYPGWNQVKCERISPLSLFLQFFCRCSLFFLQGEINSWGGRDRKISALVSAPVSALYMSFGSQGWTALLELVDTAGPKV